jgi:hypothetical protein
MRKLGVYFIGILGLLIMFSCSDKKTDTGTIKIVFGQEVNGEELKVDKLIYTNEAGNPFLVSEIQYFLSDLSFKGDALQHDLPDSNFSHYVDTDIKESKEWIIPGVKVGDYHSLSFTFGFDSINNYSRRFPNPPESHMFWPDFLGGGYHYMKLNGKWEPEKDAPLRPFNFHLGIGQVYQGTKPHPDSVVRFVHNHFDKKLNHNFSVKAGDTTVITLNMKVEEWFKNPNTYDFNFYGGKIMQDQEAMEKGCENGINAFYIRD